MNLGFHYRDGWHFTRGENGEVIIHHKEGGMVASPAVHVLTIDEAGWASIVASVSKGSETGESFRAARAFHAGEKP